MTSDDDHLAEVDALYLELGPGLIRYLRRLLQHSSGLAEDIAQDAFLILWRRWPDVRNHPNLRGYLFKTARHLAMDTLQERSREYLKEEPPEEEGADRGDPADRYDDAVSVAVREAVGKLPRRQREAVWLFYFQDFAQNDIATIMQIKRGAVGALLYQARIRLAAILGWPAGEGKS